MPIKEEIKAQKINFKITDDMNLSDGNLREKYQKNIKAIKLLKELEFENRLATAEEQKILAQYTGWGGNPKVFDENALEWKNEYNELKQLLTEDEYKQAKESVLNAFYTEPEIIKGIYNALDKIGVKKGNVLEPSAGVGNFLGMLPDSFENSHITGVELDKISGQQQEQKALAAQPPERACHRRRFAQARPHLHALPEGWQGRQGLSKRAIRADERFQNRLEREAWPGVAPLFLCPPTHTFETAPRQRDLRHSANRPCVQRALPSASIAATRLSMPRATSERPVASM